MGKPKTSIIWKRSDLRAKLSEIWDPQVVVVHMWHTFDHETLKVILGSFGALAIFFFFFLQFGLNDKKYEKTFCIVIRAKWWEIDMLLLYISIENDYGESNDTITFDLEWPWRSKSSSLGIRSRTSCKRAELGHMLLLNINRKSYMGNPLVRLHLTWVTLKCHCQGISDFGDISPKRADVIIKHK